MKFGEEEIFIEAYVLDELIKTKNINEKIIN